MVIHAKNAAMNLYFDLDGTLIDSKPRLYHLFQHLIPQSNLSFNEYWELKRSKKTHKVILETQFNFQENDLILFEKHWMNLIEDDHWLKFDKPFEEVTDYLLKLKQNNFSLYLSTARQLKNKVFNQLENFGWNNLFTEILITEQKTEKAELLKRFVSEKSKGWMIGDTDSDIKTGKLLNQKTVAVLSGFQSKEILQSLQPDLIVDCVINFLPQLTT